MIRDERMNSQNKNYAYWKAKSEYILLSVISSEPYYLTSNTERICREDSNLIALIYQHGSGQHPMTLQTDSSSWIGHLYLLFNLSLHQQTPRIKVGGSWSYLIHILTTSVEENSLPHQPICYPYFSVTYLAILRYQDNASRALKMNEI